jgi:hypothetical protein
MCRLQHRNLDICMIHTETLSPVKFLLMMKNRSRIMIIDEVVQIKTCNESSSVHHSNVGRRYYENPSQDERND